MHKNRIIVVVVLLNVLICFSVDIFAGGAIMSWKDENGQIHFGDRPPNEANMDDDKVNVIRGSSMFGEPKEEVATQSKSKTRQGMDPNDPNYYSPQNQLKRVNQRKMQEQIEAYEKNRPDYKNKPTMPDAYQSWRQKQVDEDNAWARENGYISPHDKDWKQKVKSKCIANRGSVSECSSEKYLKNHKPVTKAQRETIDRRNQERQQERARQNGFY